MPATSGCGSAPSPLTGTWADSNSGGSVCIHLRKAGYDALVVSGKAAEPTLLAIRDGEVTFESATHLWGMEIPETFDAIKAAHSDAGLSKLERELDALGVGLRR